MARVALLVRSHTVQARTTFCYLRNCCRYAAVEALLQEQRAMLVLPAFEASETSTALAAAAGAFCPSVTNLQMARFPQNKLVQASSHLQHVTCACAAFDRSRRVRAAGQAPSLWLRNSTLPVSFRSSCSGIFRLHSARQTISGG